MRSYKPNVNIKDIDVPSIDGLRALNHVQIPIIKRKSYLGKITKPYNNIFYKEGDIAWIHHPFICMEREILNIYKSDLANNVSDNVMLNNMIRYASKLQ